MTKGMYTVTITITETQETRQAFFEWYSDALQFARDMNSIPALWTAAVTSRLTAITVE